MNTKKGLLAHAVHSQIEMHQVYGGVVPELASRDHIRRVLPLTHQVIKEAGLTLSDIDAVAFTAGPGLAGALLVTSSVAQAFAWSHQLPLIPIHHLEGHLLSPLMSSPAPTFPFIALLVSGGHTQIMRVNQVGDYELLGETLDDAAGEAFDKSAKLMGLPYPGGPHLSKLATQGDAKRFNFPRPMKHSSDYDFSFSGLKTAVMTQIKKLNKIDAELSFKDKADIAAGVQEAIVDVLGHKVFKALKDTGLKRLVVAGGVGANQQLRNFLIKSSQKINAEVFFPPLELCTDNGAMIAFAAAQRVNAGLENLNQKEYNIKVNPRWDLSEV